jgi:UDP-N-acetylmuramoyl-tripeptide--D-alanyl-D-alanine ligase
MAPVTLRQVIDWTGARLVGMPRHPADEPLFSGVGTDTRTFKAGGLFVALSGENFDGSTFVAKAVAAGAAAAIVADDVGGVPPGFPLLRVPDTLAALQALAAAYRLTLPTRVLGVTGSNGKTTTKEFCAKVIGSTGSVAATRGNLNNHIGVPLTLLSIEPGHAVAVVEMGMNHAGETAPLAEMARPEAGIITNVGVAHIEHLGNREAIAEEKAALARALPADGCLIIDAEGDFADYLAGQTAAPTVRVGFSKGEVRAASISFGPEGSRFTVREGSDTAECLLPVPGEHMVRNALFAVAAGRYFGIGLDACAAALARASAGSGRLQQREIRGVHVIDDSYNANPDSMVAALETAARMVVPGRKFAALGQMNELGSLTVAGHRAVGKAAAGRVDHLITVGPVAEDIARAATESGLSAVEALGDVGEAAARLDELLKPGDLLLVKGSRGARMERVIQAYERGAGP